MTRRGRCGLPPSDRPAGSSQGRLPAVSPERAGPGRARASRAGRGRGVTAQRSTFLPPKRPITVLMQGRSMGRRNLRPVASRSRKSPTPVASGGGPVRHVYQTTRRRNGRDGARNAAGRRPQIVRQYQGNNSHTHKGRSAEGSC